MLVQINTVSSTSLNSGTAFNIEVSKPIINHSGGQNYFYNTRQMKIKNSSNALLYYLPVTEKEYEQYLLHPTITDLIPIATGETHDFDTIYGTISKVIVKGTTSHNSTATFSFYKRGGV